MTPLEDIRRRISILSNPSKGPRQNGARRIYTSFTLPGLDDMVAKRDTMDRLRRFGVPADLSGKTAIDVGCNVGAVSFELARRGAVVAGVEYDAARVTLCTDIALEMRLNSCFDRMDLNAQSPGGKWDIVWCSAVDQYIDDRAKFYRTLRSLCRETLYLESNDRKSHPAVELVEAGFASVRPLGLSDGSRRMFVAEVS